MSLKRHVWVAIAMYAALMAFFWFESGATVRVKLADATPLTFGFLMPALFLVKSARDFNSRFWQLLAIVLVTLLAYDFLITQLVAKHDLFYWWYVIYPLGALFLIGLLYIHSLLSDP